MARRKSEEVNVPSSVDLDPLLIAVLEKMPPVGPWAAPSRARWFGLFAAAVSAVYDLSDLPVESSITMSGGPAIEIPDAHT
jgi:hypothetical protein